jgi:hypothetical protein
VIGGLLAFGCTCGLASALLSLLPLPELGIFRVWVFSVFGGFCGGYLAAAFAVEAKWRHCFYVVRNYLMLFPAVGALYLCLDIVFLTHQRFNVNLLKLYPQVLLAAATDWRVVGIAGASAVALVAGCTLERFVTGTARLLHPRLRWAYVTADGRRVAALGPWRHPLLALLWRVVGWLFVLTCWVPLVHGRDDNWFGRAGGVLTLLVLSRMCFVVASKCTARSARDVLAATREPPIVYLRSFRDDGRLSNPGVLETVGNVFLANTFLLLKRTVEQRLARIMSGFGPFVAIGKPGEELAETGAGRMYVSDDDWQTVVADLLGRRDTLAVLQAGETQGLRWELSRIGRDLKPGQVLLFLPFALWHRGRARERHYAAFRAWAGECLPVALPERIGNSCFVYFSPDRSWRPQVLTRRQQVPQHHPLRYVLEELQRDRAFWPGNAGLLLKVAVVLFVLPLFLCSTCIVGMLLNGAGAAANSAERAPPRQQAPAGPR